jgi:sulfur-oxidizing protein SoxY
MLRRRLLLLFSALSGCAGLLRPLLAFGAWNEAAFSMTTESDAMRALFGDATVTPSADITIETHDLVENGAYVPVRIEARLPDVSSITILVEKNPNPLIAEFELGPGCRPSIATRIKVGAPSDVIAVVRSAGRLFGTRRFIEVVEGGCS